MKKSSFVIIVSVALGSVVMPVQAQTFYVASGHHENPTIDRVDSTGAVSLFATQSVASSYFYGLDFDPSGNLFVADAGTGRVDKIDPTGAISLFASFPSGTRLSGLALDSNNNVYVADYGSSNQVWKITPDGTANVFAALPAGSLPFGLAFDHNGNLFVANNQSGQIDEIAPSGAVSLFATLPGNTRPFGLVFDSAGNLFVADQINFTNAQIHKITPGGTVSLLASWFFTSTVYDLACDDNDNLFAGIYENGNIYKITSSGMMTTFATGVDSPTFIVIAPVPEPATWAMLALGVPILFAVRFTRERRP